MYKRYLIYGTGVLLVISGFIVASQITPGQNPSNQGALITQFLNGDFAPDFLSTDLDGKNYTLSQFKDKQPVLIEFFAVWCHYCQNQVPVINKIAKDNAVRGLVILNINSDTRNLTGAPITKEDLLNYKNTFLVEEPILFDKGDIGQKYGIRGFPTFVLIDKSGKITWQGSGETSAEIFQAEIDKVL